MKVYLDASLSKAVIGIGVRVLGPGKRTMSIGSPVRSGLNSTEAELYALILAIDTAVNIVEGCGKTTKDVTFYMDCDPAIKALYGLTHLRSETAKTLVQKAVKSLDKAKGKYFRTWSIQPIRSKDNPAHDIAKATRIRWREIWKPK